RVPQLFTNALKVAVLTNRINVMAAKLKAAARNPAEAKEWDDQAAGMRNRIVERAKTITDLLALPEPTVVKFGTNGVAQIFSWRTKTDTREANPNLTRAS